jgi:hypothetical protein
MRRGTLLARPFSATSWDGYVGASQLPRCPSRKRHYFPEPLLSNLIRATISPLCATAPQP